MDHQIVSAITVFEGIEKIRRGREARLTHLGRNRRCLDCGRDFMPKNFEPCPECGSEDTRLLKKKRKCKACEHTWEPTSDRCTWKGCYSSNTEPHPLEDKYLSDIAIPRLKVEEDFYEARIKEMISDHPVWNWACHVKGAGLTTTGRLIGKIDIRRLNTISEMYAHCGFGLEADGTPQRKHAGQKITYNAQLQSNCVMLGESLMMAGVRNRCNSCHEPYSKSSVKCKNCGTVYRKSKTQKKCPSCESPEAISGQCPFCGATGVEEYGSSKYGQIYVNQKRANATLTPLHRHNRAFRHMIKLFLSNMWEVWREGEGLPVEKPYAFAILKHPEGHLIDPWEMTD